MDVKDAFFIDSVCILIPLSAGSADLECACVHMRKVSSFIIEQAQIYSSSQQWVPLLRVWCVIITEESLCSSVYAY